MLEKTKHTLFGLVILGLLLGIPLLMVQDKKEINHTDLRGGECKQIFIGIVAHGESVKFIVDLSQIIPTGVSINFIQSGKTDKLITYGGQFGGLYNAVTNCSDLSVCAACHGGNYAKGREKP